ncbi:hypothetical protein QNI19_11235 [Cytophagaceae bacterium DM2B3-1]|uniref:Uncharacterized protein n=2 Tax=Xanthocytophaga flava TaxID=3048013 RepID=A0ABT7CKF9_9BACT|nr:hypothetical protein [Xanthocytophaga flavus]MDJ1493507.1 hypothetical protein [Xanthocytophaga flavus]
MKIMRDFEEFTIFSPGDIATRWNLCSSVVSLLYATAFPAAGRDYKFGLKFYQGTPIYYALIDWKLKKIARVAPIGQVDELYQMVEKERKYRRYQSAVAKALEEIKADKIETQFSEDVYITVNRVIAYSRICESSTLPSSLCVEFMYYPYYGWQSESIDQLIPL